MNRSVQVPGIPDLADPESPPLTDFAPTEAQSVASDEASPLPPTWHAPPARAPGLGPADLPAPGPARAAPAPHAPATVRPSGAPAGPAPARTAAAPIPPAPASRGAAAATPPSNGPSSGPGTDTPTPPPAAAAPPAGDGVPDPAARPSRPGTDPLLNALVWLTRHHGRERSPDALLATTPVDGLVRPDQAVRVLQEAGYHASLLPRPLAEISPLLFPVVALLRQGDACIITRRHPGHGRAGHAYDVVLPGADGAQCQVGERELQQEYLGHVLAVAPQMDQQAAGPEGEALLRQGQHWLWGTLRRFTPYYRAALMAALISNLMMLVSGLVTSIVFDKVIPHQAFVTLWTLAAGAFLALGLDLAARQLRSHLIDSSGRRADLIIGSLLFRQTLGVRMEHRPASSGAYAHHLAQIETVRDFFASATLSTLSDLPFIALFVAMTFAIGGPLGWVLALSIPVILGLVLLIQGALRRSMQAGLAHQTDLQGVLVEAVDGLEDLKAAGAQGRFLRRYEHATALAASSALQARTLASWSNNLSAAAQQAVTLIMLVWGVYLIRDGVITAGALVGAVMFAGRAIAPLGSVVSLAVRYQGARAALQSLDRLMQLPVERDADRAYLARPRLGGALALQHARFSYPPTGTDRPPVVLGDVTLQIRPGERVAILGRIGSGKSTILRLLAGLYQPTEGRVEADGVDLRQIDPADFRARVGFVTQDPRLFSGTLRDNVLLHRASADAERLTHVAALTGLDRLITSHPLGWDLPVGERGGLLSGGQRQLVALARCLVTEPRILLLDEPTSSMDAQSELLFLQRLAASVADRTLVVVTHRPAVLELVQRIVVVDAGRIVADGPKAQVLTALSGAPAAPAADGGSR